MRGELQINNHCYQIEDHGGLFDRLFDNESREHIGNVDTINVAKVTPWILALESGKYKQGQCSLKYFDKDMGSYKYCCLGVLGEFNDVNKVFDLLDEVLLPMTYYREIVPSFVNDQAFFVELNDEQEFSFKDIAKVLRFILENHKERTVAID